MVVTASRLEESNFEANANVNVVTRKDIEEKHYQTVSDALRAVPGVAIQNYSATGANYSADYLYVNGTTMFLFWWMDRERTPMVLHLAYSNLPK